MVWATGQMHHVLTTMTPYLHVGIATSNLSGQVDTRPARQLYTPFLSSCHTNFSDSTSIHFNQPATINIIHQLERIPTMIPHRIPSVSEASSSSAHDSSRSNNLRPLVPASRPAPADTPNAYRTAPLTRKRAPISLACEPCRQKKIKAGLLLILQCVI